MKIAVPVVEGKLCMHFGHCEVFAFVEVDPETREVKKVEFLPPPPHAPGVIPPWVAQQGASHVIAGGMGGRAIQLFESAGVHVITGAPSLEPEELAKQYLSGELVTGKNVCDHGPNHIPGSCDH